MNRLIEYYTAIGAATWDSGECNCLAGTKQPITRVMFTHSKLASCGISATDGLSSRAESNQASMNDTEVKVEVKREPEIDVFERDDHREE